MSLIEAMRTLTEDLKLSHEQRRAGLTTLRSDVRDALDDTRQRIAARHVARLDAAAALHKELAENADVRRDAVEAALAGLASARRDAAIDQQRRLARATADRRDEVRGMRADTQKTMHGVHSDRVANESQLRATLGHDRADLFDQVSDLMSGINKAREAAATDQRKALNQSHATLTAEIDDFLNNVRLARAGMADIQRKTLATGQAAIHAEVTSTIAGFRAARREVGDEIAEASKVWGAYANGQTGSASTPSAAKRKVKPVAQATNSTNRGGLSDSAKETTSVRHDQTPPAAGETAAGRVRAETPTTVTPEAVFSYLADHPDGVRLTELEDNLGAPRIRLANILARLIEENKARKDEERKLYFAT